MFRNFYKVTKILVLKSPKNFIFMVILLLSQMIVVSVSVFSIIPLADYILDSELTNSSFFTKKFISVLTLFEINPSFFIFAVFFLFTQFLIAVTSSLISYIVLTIKYDFMKKMQDETLQKLMFSKWSYFTKSNYGYLQNTFIKEIDKIGHTVGHIANSIAFSFQLLIFMAVPLYIDFQVTLIVILIFIVFAFVVLKFVNPLSQKFGKRNVETSNLLIGKFNEILNSIKTIKINSKEIFFKKKYLNIFQSHISATLRSQLLGHVVNAFYRPSGIMVILIVFIYFLKNGALISELAAIFYSLISIVSILNSIIGIQVNINNFIPSYDQVNEILKDAELNKENFGSKKFEAINQKIEIKNLRFQYKENKPVLKDINMTIKKNETVAFVGKSGSGKTTLADLIGGIFASDKGSIKIDGNDLKGFDISTYRNKLGYVSQEVHLFNDTVKNNLIWVCDDKDKEKITDEEIINVLKLSNAFEFINNLDKGINSIIGDKGIQLSGGQRQRLSLARVFLKKPKLLILDEATSALDNLSEMEIQKSISKLKSMFQTTVIIIAHRLSTVKNADNIFVLNNGTIEDQGRFEELKNKENQLFKSLTLEI
jgi:ABC-type multidrug transport system fused ATPase/permease subunit